MTDLLLLRQPSLQSDWEWLRVSPSGEPAQVEQGPQEAAAEASAGRRVVLLLPGAHITRHIVRLPLRGPRLLAAAPYAMEDGLAEDIDDLHFATAPLGSGHTGAIVHVIRQTILTEALAQLESWGPLDIVAVVPDFCLLPACTAEVPVLCATPECWMLQTPEGQLLTLPVGGLPGWKESLDEQPVHFISVAGATAPEDLSLARRTDVDSLLDLPIRIENLRKASLLQGPFARRERGLGWLRDWAWPAALAASFILVHCALLGWAVLNTAAEAEQTRQLAEQTFKETFPGITRIVDMRVQAQQQLAAAEASQGHSRVLELMATSAQALAQAPGLKLDNLQFRDQALYISLSGEDLAALETLRGHLERDPSVRLEVQSAQAGNDGVRIRLKLEKA